jgi:hypothetical protein
MIWRKMMNIDFPQINLSESNDKCKGLIYRARKNVFINSRGEIIDSKRMIPMKRLSCPGCRQCEFLLGDLREWIYDYPITVKPGFEDGELYELCVLWHSTDWETGLYDDYEIGFEKLVDDEE